MYSEFTAFSIFSMSTSDPVTPTDNRKPAQISDLEQSGSPSSSLSPKTTPSLGGLSATSAEAGEEGFLTPTSSDHKIPEARPCPPPPRKSTATGHRRMRPPKRKSSPDDVWSLRRQRDHSQTPILMDLSSEIESMFPPILRANFTCKIKKARSV